MKKGLMRKIITSISLMLAMIMNLLPVAVHAEEAGVWEPITLTDITAEDTIAITMTNNTATYMLPAAASSNAPTAVKTTITDGKLNADVADYGWKITAVEGGFTIGNTNGYLQSIDSNNGVRVNNTEPYTVWTVDSETGYLKATNTSRYVGIYSNQDWRSYTSVNANITGQTLGFWKLTGTEAPEPLTVSVPTVNVEAGEVEKGTVVSFTSDEGATISYSTDGNTWTEGTSYTVNEDVTIKVKAVIGEAESQVAEFAYTVKSDAPVELNTIAEALAGEDNAEFTVKGVVTMVDKRNVYVQDATGAICLYLSAADSSIQLGDTLIGKGTRAEYNGMKQLSNATAEKSEGLSLEAKETTISALTADDVCSYVSLKGLTVTNVNGTNIDVEDADGKSIQIYKAVSETVEKGDILNVKAAVGIYKTTLQLRNTKADEIEITKGEVPVTTPTASPAAGEIVKGTEVTFTSDEGAVISYSVDGGTTWIEGTSYTVNEDVTIKVKAVKDEAESEIAEFTYTVRESDPYADIPAYLNVYQKIDKPAKDDVVVIYNATNKKGLKDVFSGYYLAGEDLEAENNLIATAAEDIEWTVTVNDDETYTFVQDENTLAGVQTENNGRKYNNISLSAEDNKTWELTECNAENGSWYISNAGIPSSYESDGGKVYLEWYGNKTAFSLYDTAKINEDVFGMTFYKLVREKTAEQSKPPVADVEAGEVEKGTVVTFTAEEGTTISYSTDGETWTEGTSYTVNEDVTIKVKAVTDEAESEIAEFAYTVKKEDVPAGSLYKMTELPADGDKVVIYHPSSKMVLTSTASGKKLAGVEAVVTDDVMEQKADMALLTVHVEGDAYLFELDGKYLTTGETGGNATFADDSTSDLVKWTPDMKEDGTFTMLNVGAAYKENHNQAFEYYNGFTVYGIKDEPAYVFEFYSDEAPVVYDTIAEALAGEENTEFTVKGVVTLADGKNIYVQDATGGICLYLSAADNTVKLGDTLIGKGTRTAYKGLPELKVTELEKSKGLTLKAKDTTIGALTTADVCTYVKLTDLEVTEVYDYNGAFTTPNITVKDSEEKTIQIYKAIVAKNDGEWAVKAGDKVDVTAAVGINNTTLQLRNTKAEEIVVVEAGESVAAPTVDVEPGEVEKGTVLTFSAEEGAVISYSVDNGKTWTEGSTYTVDDEVTIQVKAVKGDIESKVVTFAYTVAGIIYEDQAVSDISQLTNGVNVVIYNKAHKTAISSKPNGDWYLKAVDTTVAKGTIKEFVEDLVWTVKVNRDGTYSFYSAFDDSRSITVWPSNNYAELSVNVEKYPDNKWTLTPAKTDKAFYMHSPAVSTDAGPAYVEAYVRYGTEVYSGYFTTPMGANFNDSDYGLQFYIVNKDDAIEAYDDGEWDGVLNKGDQYVIYNVASESAVGLYDEANFSMKAIPSVIEEDKTKAGNGAYVFTVDSMGRYYTFKTNGKFLSTNNDEELFLLDPKDDGTAPETAKWYLKKEECGYILYNKEANYNGTPVCIEYYSSVFSGWTFSTKNDLNIYLFNFYKLTDDTKIYNDIVQAPSVLINSEDFRYIEQDYHVEFVLDDLSSNPEVQSITYTSGEKTGTVTDFTGNDRTFTFTIPAADIDGEKAPESFTFRIDVKNDYGIEYYGEKEVEIRDEPFFTALTPAPNSQTKDDKKPVISAKIGNVGENPTFTMTINDEEVETEFKDGVLSYTPAEDLADGRTTVKINVKREDGIEAEKAWSFTVGISDYQLYFGQLHSHTTYSDGSGTLDAALEYIASLPESANVDFVAFTDHSNYFDTTSAANPADAMNDKSLMTPASLDKWNEYKNKVAAFNESQSDVIAIAGFEMTWSGGPGHINSYNTDGLVSRNNAELNNKSGDAGMKLYYATMNKDNGETMHQFNHPGATFGNFTDFSYWDEETDKRMFLVEVGNGEGQIGAGGYYPSYEEYTLALDKGWHVGPTNNQDNHKGRWGNANDARDVILTNNFSEEGIYDAIRARRIYATEDKNLQIIYTLNGEQMGTIFGEENVPEKLNIEVTLYDPDNSDSISKAEVIVDGGMVAHTWNNKEELTEGALSVELEPEYSYYYIRVTQEDGDLAVTAPVWVGQSTQAGIKEIKNDPEKAIVNEDETITTTLFNNEDVKATVKSITYTTDGSKVLGTDTKAHEINANGTLDVPFTFKPEVAKRMTVTVTVVMDVSGKEMTYNKDIIISVRETDGDLPVTAIAEVQAQKEEGFEYAIEGVVTSNASGYDKDTAFFDCIYVEDETAGICCFPVSGEYKIGDKVHIEGYTDFYQGEAELQVESIEVIGEGTIEPKEVNSEQINDLSVLGSLVTLKGTITEVEEANGLIQTIMVKDEAGEIARVFIDGYITTGKEVENCTVGAEISATGLSSYDDTWPDTDYFARIRIRNREDIVCDRFLFDDVQDPEKSFYEPVYWAYNNGITTGTSTEPPLFSPFNTCTRAQFVTFLWRQQGSPEPKTTENPFKDVEAGKSYSKAVLWAFENGITTGTSDTTFDPFRKVTRGQVAAFLYRAAGEPEVKGINPFEDVPAGRSFTNAVIWMVDNKITTGKSETVFDPYGDCTRGQTVTFLYRTYANQ